MIIINYYQTMVDLTYNVSDKLKSYLDISEDIRKRILLAPISPKVELRLKWEANLERIKWSLSLLDDTLSKSDIFQLLSKAPKRKLTSQEKNIIDQRKAFSYIREDWLVSNKTVTMATIKKLYDISCRPTLGKMAGLTQYSEKNMQAVLDYLQNGQENPIIQAGIAQIQLIKTRLFDNGNGRISRLLSYLLLYKNGYDAREMVILDEFYRKDLMSFKKAIETALAQKNLTYWLEYFSYGMMVQLKKALDIINNEKFQQDLPAAFWKINDRHRDIVRYLEQPGLRITNKNVQKMFGVSQITASRDLAKLSNLGLLFPHGKGRSVYYTRV